MLTKIAGLVRGAFAGNYPEADEDKQLIINNRGDLAIAQSLPPRSELVRLGQSWLLTLPTASAFTFVAAWPTTRYEISLWNGEPDGGKSYVIDSCFMTNITSMAAAQPMSLLAQMAPARVAAPAAGVSIFTPLGKNKIYGGAGVSGVAVTTAVANKWMAIGAAYAAMTTNLGGTILADTYGLFVVPPGGQFGLAGLAGTAAGTAIVGLVFHEVQLTLG